MSVCSNTIRAWSRSRKHPSKTLLPFLYQTATIQQWHTSPHSIARRNIISRPNYQDDIPFEDDNLPHPVNQEPARKTTITGTERAAFEKLYKRFNTQGRANKDKDHVEELDQIADEYYEDDEEAPTQSLDKVFDEVLRGKPRLRASRAVSQGLSPGDKKLGQDAQSIQGKAVESEAKTSRRKKAKADASKLRQLRQAERERIDKLMQNAPTDRELRQILEREVFVPVRNLDLDSTKEAKEQPSTTKTSKKKTKSKPEPKAEAESTNSKSEPKPTPPTIEQRVLFQNYPNHLVTAIQTLRSQFPSSQLPLSILPTMKSLGRSSYALGASTLFYTHLLRCAWIQHSSYPYILSLLSEMDNSAVEFDTDILTLLDSMIKEHDMACAGNLGKDIQTVYSMEQFLDGAKKIREWRRVVRERLGVASEELKDSGRVVRRVGRNVGVGQGGVDTRSPRGLRNVDTRVKDRGQPVEGRNRARKDHVPLVEGKNYEPAGEGKDGGERVVVFSAEHGQETTSETPDKRDEKAAPLLL